MLSIYKASAGSGKTFALTREYIRMLLSDKTLRDSRLPHSRILAVTFTKKSTAEMKERILKELFILAQNPDSSAYINDYIADSNIGLNKQEIQQRAQLLMLGILQDYNRFSVSTIDGFFQQIVRTFAIDLGLSTTYDLSLDHKDIVNQAVDDIFRRIREIKPEDEDLTTWLVEYALNNIEDNRYWNPIEQIKKFSEELSKERLVQQLDELKEIFSDKEKIRDYYAQLKQIYQEVLDKVKVMHDQIKQKICTFNLDMLNSNAISLRNKTPEELLSEGLGSTLLKVINETATFYKKKDVSAADQKAIQNRYERELKHLFIALRDILYGKEAFDFITAKSILKKLYSLGILLDVDAQIKHTNHQQGRLPISDINQLIYQIIDGQEAPFIYERIGQHYHHYMIDEFQDTSTLQWKNFRPLIEETESKGFNNLIVGDVKQSIYRFRNSDWHLLTQVDKEFRETEFPAGMDGNWRTAPEIVENNERLMQQYCNFLVEELNSQYPDHETSLNEIAKIYSHSEMHQKAKKKFKGYFHMQFLEGAHFEEQALEALIQQIQSFEQEHIDLARVTILTQTSKEAEMVAKHLIKNAYEVQSTQGLKIDSHKAIQVLLTLLRNYVQPDKIHTIFLNKILGDIETYGELIEDAQKYPLYTHIQKLIDGLQLHTWEGATPYITAFQEKIYQFTQSKVADCQLFINYWDKQGHKATIPAPKTSSAITIMTIHASKGLEFDIVMIPFFNWKLRKYHNDTIIWCTPTQPPFDILPLVPVHPSHELLRSHLAEDYILEELAVYTDFLNLTYVAITRPKYRLYLYAPTFTANKKTDKPTTIGKLMHWIYSSQLNENAVYSSLQPNEQLPPLPEKDKQESNIQIQTSQYISIPMDNNRLKLRSRSNDEFDTDTPISHIDLGNLMHLWLSEIQTWEDAQPALQKLIAAGQVSENQLTEMQQQLAALQSLIAQNNHNEWFEGKYQTLTEQTIITPSGELYRPDRVMIMGKHAIIIDYKFGNQESAKYIKQIQLYMHKLQEIGYSTEGYIVYNQLRIIKHIQR